MRTLSTGPAHEVRTVQQDRIVVSSCLNLCNNSSGCLASCGRLRVFVYETNDCRALRHHNTHTVFGASSMDAQFLWWYLHPLMLVLTLVEATAHLVDVTAAAGDASSTTPQKCGHTNSRRVPLFHVSAKRSVVCKDSVSPGKKRGIRSDTSLRGPPPAIHFDPSAVAQFRNEKKFLQSNPMFFFHLEESRLCRNQK